MEFVQRLADALEAIYKDEFSYSDQRINFIRYWGGHLRDLAWLYENLADAESKNTFARLLQYNFAAAMLGGGARKHQLYSERQWQEFTAKATQIEGVPNDYLNDRIETFILEGYRYNDLVTIKEGSVVMDCGAFTGNTTKYFAEKVGSSGKVYAFEPMEKTYKSLVSNLEKYDNIMCNNLAIFKDDRFLNFTAFADADSRISTANDTVQVQAISIDSFVRKNNISKIDFIKMDIEGAELEALKGARDTIIALKPVLAICVYHKKEDFIAIPAYLRQLGTFRFYLKHNKYTFGETVLFAVPDAGQSWIEISAEEFKLVSTLWHSFEQIYYQKQKMIKKSLLYSYNSILAEICRINFNVECSSTYDYLALWISERGKLHYEFAFTGGLLNIALHFEGDFKKIATPIIKEIIDKSAFSNLITYTNDIRAVVCIRTKNFEDSARTAKLMSLLIKLTLPILGKHKLLANDILLQNPNLLTLNSMNWALER